MSSGSGNGLSGQAYVSGTNLKTVKLAATVLGGLFTAVGVGVGGVASAWFATVVGAVEGVGAFGARLLGESLGLVVDMGTLAWSLATIPTALGPLAPVLALAFVLLYLLILREGDE